MKILYVLQNVEYRKNNDGYLFKKSNWFEAIILDWGVSRIFIQGGGGTQKIICANTHYEREIRSPVPQESRARLRALEALVFFFNALQCHLSPTFKHSGTKWVIQISQSIQFYFCACPLDPSLLKNSMNRRDVP